MLYKTTATITTDGSGDATVYLGSIIRGWIESIKYLPGTIATGADLTITVDSAGTPVLTKANAGTSNLFFYPRALGSKVADGSDGSEPTELIPVFEDRVKVVVAQGGDTKAGSIELIYRDDV
jgi:hypothetical protein